MVRQLVKDALAVGARVPELGGGRPVDSAARRHCLEQFSEKQALLAGVDRDDCVTTLLALGKIAVLEASLGVEGQEAKLGPGRVSDGEIHGISLAEICKKRRSVTEDEGLQSTRDRADLYHAG